MRNEKGMTFLMLIIIIVIVIALIGTATFFILQGYHEAEFDSMRTDMLSVQGKIKVLSESSIAKKDDAIKKGLKLIESEEDEKIKSILEKGIISKEEENYEQYYILNIEDLNEIGLSSIEIQENGYIIVNYKTYEVIYTQGIKIEGNEYFKLSELNKIKEDREIALNEQALEKEKATEQTTQEQTEQITQEQTEQTTEQQPEQTNENEQQAQEVTNPEEVQ